VIWEIAFHPDARVEVLEAQAWYAERHPAIGDAFMLELDRLVAAVAASPITWSLYLEGTRRRLFPRLPYALIYRVLSDRVEVVAVAHQRRRPGYWAGR
jgi:plasmid stabilization system protein ParE